MALAAPQDPGTKPPIPTTPTATSKTMNPKAK